MTNYRENYGEEDWEKSGVQECRIALEIMKLIREKHTDLPLSPDCSKEGSESFPCVVSAAGNGSMSCVLITQFHAEGRTPDIVFKIGWDCCVKDSSRTWLELTGANGKYSWRFTDYWVQHEKVEYTQKYPERDILTVLQYFDPDERFVVVKVDPEKTYDFQPKKPANNEPMATFTDDSPEVIGHGLEFIADYIAEKLRATNPNTANIAPK